MNAQDICRRLMTIEAIINESVKDIEMISGWLLAEDRSRSHVLGRCAADLKEASKELKTIERKLE